MNRATSCSLTLVIAILVLIIGRMITANVAFRTYSIPEPVVGGFVAALAITLTHATMDANISVDMALQTPLLLAFFSIVGLSADLSGADLSGVAYLQQE